MTEQWPAVSYDRWGATCDTLHAALRLTARGLETGTLPAPDGTGSLVVALDLHAHAAAVEFCARPHSEIDDQRSVGWGTPG